jgi:hypothetical protein
MCPTERIECHHRVHSSIQRSELRMEASALALSLLLEEGRKAAFRLDLLRGDRRCGTGGRGTAAEGAAPAAEPVFSAGHDRSFGLLDVPAVEYAHAVEVIRWSRRRWWWTR